MSYHDCSGYGPTHANIGDTYRCICGVEYKLVRKFPWKKWEQIKDDSDNRHQGREKLRNISG